MDTQNFYGPLDKARQAVLDSSPYYEYPSQQPNRDSGRPPDPNVGVAFCRVLPRADTSGCRL